MLTNSSIAYGSVAKLLHWLIAILIVCMLIFGYFLGDVPKEYQPITYNIHKLTGLTILILMVFRLWWALMNVKPALPFDTLSWQRLAERVVHWSLYAIIIAMPIAGWIGSSAADRPPHVGKTKLLLPVEQSESLMEASFNVHNTLALIIIALVSIHVLAALYHHVIKKDNVLRRMLPHRRDRQPFTS